MHLSEVYSSWYVELWLVVCVSDEQRTVPRAAPQRKTLRGGYLSTTVSKHIVLQSLCQMITSDSKHLGNSQEFSWNSCGSELFQQSWQVYSLAWETPILEDSNSAPPHLCPQSQAWRKQHKVGGSCGILSPWSPILMGLLTHHRNSSEMLACFPTLWNGNLKHFPLN